MVKEISIMTTGGSRKVRSLCSITRRGVITGCEFESVIHVIPIRQTITDANRNAILALTHETSGLSLCPIDASVVAEFCDGKRINYVALAKRALSMFEDKHGKARVSAALSTYDVDDFDDDIPF